MIRLCEVNSTEKETGPSDKGKADVGGIGNKKRYLAQSSRFQDFWWDLMWYTIICAWDSAHLEKFGTRLQSQEGSS